MWLSSTDNEDYKATNEEDEILASYDVWIIMSGCLHAQFVTSGVARPGPTSACALPSTFQAGVYKSMPSQASKDHVIL